jgi:HEPN domain-containing protein
LSPEHREYAELMLDRGQREMRAAQQLLATEERDETIIGFHLHQAIEKAAKAVLAVSEIEIPYTHDLGKLFSALLPAGIELPAGLASVAWLTPWGTTFRYEDPNDDLDVDAALEAATAAIGLAEHVLDEDNTDPAA